MHSIKLSRELTMKDGENNYPETAYNNHQIKIKWVCFYSNMKLGTKL